MVSGSLLDGGSVSSFLGRDDHPFQRNDRRLGSGFRRGRPREGQIRKNDVFEKKLTFFKILKFSA